MIFAAINWLSISISLLLVVFVIVCLMIALLVLMQRPKQEGLGAAFGGGVTDQVFGARTTSVLQKGTWFLGSLFFLLSMTLAILIGKQNKQKSLLEPIKPIVENVEQTPAPVVPIAPTLPPSLVNELPPEATPAETTPQEAAPSESEIPVTEEAPAPAETPADKPE
jgi:preprotein translocase subunit SecG